MISSSFVINQWKLYSLCDCAFSFVSRKALTTLTSLKSHSSTKRIYASFPYGCSCLNLTYVFCQLNNLIRDRKSPRKSKNNFRGITIGISKPFHKLLGKFQGTSRIPRTFFLFEHFFAFRAISSCLPILIYRSSFQCLNRPCFHISPSQIMGARCMLPGCQVSGF